MFLCQWVNIDDLLDICLSKLQIPHGYGIEKSSGLNNSCWQYVNAWRETTCSLLLIYEKWEERHI